MGEQREAGFIEATPFLYRQVQSLGVPARVWDEVIGEMFQLQAWGYLPGAFDQILSDWHAPGVFQTIPVILHQRDWARWLDRRVTERPPVDLLRPHESDAMEMAPCNPAVGNVRNNGPEMLGCPQPILGLPLTLSSE
jgi:hypothetical protein